MRTTTSERKRKAAFFVGEGGDDGDVECEKGSGLLESTRNATQRYVKCSSKYFN